MATDLTRGGPGDSISCSFRLGPYIVPHRRVISGVNSYELIKDSSLASNGVLSGLILAQPLNVAHWNEVASEPPEHTMAHWQRAISKVHQAGGTLFLPLVYALPPPTGKTWRTVPAIFHPRTSFSAVISDCQLAIVRLVDPGSFSQRYYPGSYRYNNYYHSKTKD